MTDKKEKIMKKQASREQKFFNRSRRIFQWIVTHIGYQAFLKLIYRLEVQGKENIPKDNAYIVAPNHLSLLDPPMVASVLNKLCIYVLPDLCCGSDNKLCTYFYSCCLFKKFIFQ